MNEKILLKFLLTMLNDIKLESNNIYNFLSNFLSEQSHSFGFKPLDELVSKYVDELDKIYGYHISYLVYEKFKSFSSININKIIIKNTNNSYKVFKLILDLFYLLEESSKKNGKLFSTLIEYDDISPTILFDFQPIYNLLDKYITKFDREILKNINIIDENYEDHYGIMYNFFHKDSFLNKNNYIEINGIKLKTNIDLYNYCKK